MGRWEPNARGRLEEAAMALFLERGFEQTTAAEIAARAGLAERTFFRHFADKREVLFGRATALQDQLVQTLTDAPPDTASIEAVVGAFEQAAGWFEANRARSRIRQQVIVASAELQERELIKLSTLSTALAGVLLERGVRQPVASLAAEAGVTVFKVSFQRWVEDSTSPALAELIREALDELRTVTAGGPPAPIRGRGTSARR